MPKNPSPGMILFAILMVMLVSVVCSLAQILSTPGLLESFSGYSFQMEPPPVVHPTATPTIDFAPPGSEPAFELSFVKAHDCLGKQEYPYAAFKLVNTGSVTFFKFVFVDVIDLSTSQALYVPGGATGWGFHKGPELCGIGNENYLRPGETAYVSVHLTAAPTKTYEARATVELCPPIKDSDKGMCAERSVDFTLSGE